MDLFFLDDHLVRFPGIWKSISQLSLEKLELNELKELLWSIEEEAAEALTLVTRALAYEESLSLQIKVSEDEERTWERRVDDATGLGRQQDVVGLLKRQLACADITWQLRELLSASRICTVEFIRMHSDFAAKEREILSRIEFLENCCAESSDPSTGDGDVKSKR